MVWPKSLFSNRQRALEERLGLGVFALGAVKYPQVIEAPGYVGMLRAESILSNRQRALIKRLGFGVPTLVNVKRC